MARRDEFWYCNACGAQNHVIDGECQFCECEGKDCKRNSCSDPAHFHFVDFAKYNLESHLGEAVKGCRYCDALTPAEKDN